MITEQLMNSDRRIYSRVAAGHAAADRREIRRANITKSNANTNSLRCALRDI